MWKDFQHVCPKVLLYVPVGCSGGGVSGSVPLGGAIAPSCSLMISGKDKETFLGH